MDDRATIVVGVDGSAESRAALAYAMEEAGRRDAQVRAVSVFQPPEYWAVVYGTPVAGTTALPTLEQVTTDVEQRVRRTVREVVAEQGAEVAGVPVDVPALTGSPARVLLEQARRAALLVVGHRGRGGFAGAVLGSVGLQCMPHAPCPVTVVRPVPRPAADGSPAVAALPLAT
ncbi:universal stress protein [Pseudonocardia acidicola]|uniref:Universal stress protein n=1 Tax=Pseudonocardia acidicola TaxID=2724939 RepID=A0ABX1S8V6_9PSEU|nr:universal stress protein [Pseudonocardia acidicola]